MLPKSSCGAGHNAPSNTLCAIDAGGEAGFQGSRKYHFGSYRYFSSAPSPSLTYGWLESVAIRCCVTA